MYYVVLVLILLCTPKRVGVETVLNQNRRGPLTVSKELSNNSQTVKEVSVSSLRQDCKLFITNNRINKGLNFNTSDFLLPFSYDLLKIHNLKQKQSTNYFLISVKSRRH